MSQTVTENRIDTRNYGIDLLRNVSMFFVVILHVLGAGGMLGAAASVPLKYEVLKAFHIAAMCAVNCYGLISGYVGYRSKFRLSGILILWLQVFLYSAGIGLILHRTMPEVVTWEKALELCQPVIYKQYWYFTAYFALYFTMPALNAAIEHLPRRVFEVSFGILLLLLTVGQQTFLVNNVFLTGSGYSYLWLAVLYCLGGYLAKYRKSWKNGLLCLLGYGFCVFVCWAAQYILRHLGVEKPTRLENYNSPVMVLQAVFLLLLFANLKLPKWLAKITAFFAPAAFGVYLIHTHPVVYSEILTGAFKKLSGYPTGKTVLAMIGACAGIYVACMAIDLVRHYLFRALRLKEFLSKLDEKLTPEES